jgi:tRNA(Ile)-lysidine synthase
MAGPRRLTQLVSSALERLALPKGDLVVALSGGADSAALAYLVREVGRRPRALHIDHGLEHAPLMRKAAAAIATQLGLDLELVEVVVEQGPSPEGQARRVRYQAFLDSTSPEERLLTGHTADDSAETVLLNLIRGTGPTGLGGIPAFRPPNVHRPILALTRSETREIAAITGLEFADDPMNQDPALTRNLVRRRILPFLSQLNPALVDAVTRMSRMVAEDDAFLDRLALGLGVDLSNDSASIPVGVLAAAPGPLADRVLRQMAGHVVGEDRVDAASIERIWSVLEGESSGQEIASGASARRSGPLLVISAADDTTSGPALGVAELTPGRHQIGGLVFEVAAMEGPCLVAPLSRWSAIFPAGTRLQFSSDGVVLAEGEPAWVPGEKRLSVAWYEPGASRYLSVSARREPGWTSSLSSPPSR